MILKTKNKMWILIALIFVLMFVMAVFSGDKPTPATGQDINLSEILDFR